jgi:hypothetical protein
MVCNGFAPDSVPGQDNAWKGLLRVSWLQGDAQSANDQLYTQHRPGLDQQDV